MWEGSAAAQRSARIARKWPGRRESFMIMEKTEKESVAFRRGLVEGVS